MLVLTSCKETMSSSIVVIYVTWSRFSISPGFDRMQESWLRWCFVQISGLYKISRAFFLISLSEDERHILAGDSEWQYYEPRLDREYDTKVYMACILQGSRLGMAYFDTETNAMFVLETFEHGDEEFPSMQLIKYQVYLSSA